MNILHIVGVKQHVNGVSTVASCLSREQRKLGHNVRVVNIITTADEICYLEKIHDIHTFIDNITPENTDIVIFHSLYFMEYIKIASSLKHKKIPYLIQLHGALSKQNYKKNFLKKWIANQLFFKKFIKSASAIIYLNNHEITNSIVPSINSDTIILPNGCYPPRQKTDNKATQPFKLLYLGRIDKHHKGVDKLLDSLALLKKQGIRNFSIDFYGRGEQKDMKWFKGQLAGIADIARYHGAVFGEEKSDALATHNAMILTSRSEGMPMGILEALSFGLPCIITPQTNMADVIAKYECGWITPLDHTIIANTILTAQKQYSVSHAILSANAKAAASHYDWQNVALESIKRYQSIIDRKKLQ